MKSTAERQFAALDLECATSDTGNICELGLVLMRDGQEVERFRTLVRPVVEAFGDWQRWNFDYSLKDAMKAPSFPEVWKTVEEMTDGIPFVAHNAGLVECKHLGHAFSYHQMELTHSPAFYCTLELARKQWPDLPKHGIKHLAKHFQWKLDHHNPESDARVCAAIVERVVQENGWSNWEQLVSSSHWKSTPVTRSKTKLVIAPKPTNPRKRSDYLHELVDWESSVTMEKLITGQRFVLSGFEESEKLKLRKSADAVGLVYKRYMKGPIDFVIADKRMGASKLAKCQLNKIPIISAEEFAALLDGHKNGKQG